MKTAISKSLLLIIEADVLNFLQRLYVKNLIHDLLALSVE
jgi:hypothetical protein